MRWTCESQGSGPGTGHHARPLIRFTCHFQSPPPVLAPLVAPDLLLPCLTLSHPASPCLTLPHPASLAPRLQLDIPAAARAIARDLDFDIEGHAIAAGEEQGRDSRIVRIGAIQNTIKAPTTDPVSVQMEALHTWAASAIEAAHHCGVNVLCLQECWTGPFFYCTREKEPWLEFAESAEHGPTAEFINELARKYNMVIVSPILERDDAKGTIWNTAVVHSNRYDWRGERAAREVCVCVCVCVCVHLTSILESMDGTGGSTAVGEIFPMVTHRAHQLTLRFAFDTPPTITHAVHTHTPLHTGARS